MTILVINNYRMALFNSNFNLLTNLLILIVLCTLQVTTTHGVGKHSSTALNESVQLRPTRRWLSCSSTVAENRPCGHQRSLIVWLTCTLHTSPRTTPCTLSHLCFVIEFIDDAVEFLLLRQLPRCRLNDDRSDSDLISRFILVVPAIFATFF